MFAVIVIIILGLAFTVAELLSLWEFFVEIRQRRQDLQKRYASLEEDAGHIRFEKDDYENKMAEYFFFYDLTRKLAPILNTKELLKVFREEMAFLGGIKDVVFSTACPLEYLEYRLRGSGSEALCVKTDSKKVVLYFSHLARLVSLCVERIGLYVRLQQLSIYDTLTETYNRRHFMERFSEEFERAKNHNLNMVFVMIDIDHFKKVNDTYGHMVGDVVLREVARIIMGNIREIDFLARYGGEEFALIVPDTDREGAILLGERLCQLVASQKINAFDEVVSVTISIGISVYPQNTLHADSLIDMADKALYKAKTGGRNRVAWI